MTEQEDEIEKTLETVDTEELKEETKPQEEIHVKTDDLTIDEIIEESDKKLSEEFDDGF